MNLKIKVKIIKLMKENIRENLCDFGLDKDFLEITPKAWSLKEQVDELNFKRLKKNLNHTKDTQIK